MSRAGPRPSGRALCSLPLDGLMLRRMGRRGGVPTLLLGTAPWTLDPQAQLQGPPHCVPAPHQLEDGALDALLGLLWGALPVPLRLLRLI